MKFLSADTGTLSFTDGLTLYAGMQASELIPHLHNSTPHGAALCLSAHDMAGGSLAPVCLTDQAGLHTVLLHVREVGRRTALTADKQRAFLFQAFRLRDPYPDTRRSVRVRCGFGELLFYTDPYTGSAVARVEYHRPEPSGL